MGEAVYLIAALGSPLVLGSVLWFLMRPARARADDAEAAGPASRAPDIAALRAEVSRLRAEGPAASGRPGRD